MRESKFDPFCGSRRKLAVAQVLRLLREVTLQSASGNLVIVAYKPKPGKEAALLELTREHVALLRSEGLATKRPVVAAQAADGTIVEVFEWTVGGVEKAHSNPVVLELWKRYGDACEIVPLNALAESSTMFASFTPLNV